MVGHVVFPLSRPCLTPEMTTGIWAMIRYWGPLRRQSYPPQPNFSTEQVPDLTDQVIMVTGT